MSKWIIPTRTLLLALFTLISVWQPSIAQESTARFENFNHIPELGKLAIRTVIQDNSGFIWIGSESGLYRFDGHETQRFQHDPSRTGGLSANFVYSLFQDSRGDIWVGTFGGGLDRYDSKSGQFTNYRSSKNKTHSLSNNYINTIVEDHTGMIWVGTGQGINKIDTIKDQVTPFLAPSGTSQELSRGFISSLLVDDNNHLWAGTNKGLYKVNQHTGEIDTFLTDSETPNPISDNIVLSLHQSSPQKMWIGTSKGLELLHIHTGRFEPVNHRIGINKPVKISVIKPDTQNNLWIGVKGHGLIKLPHDGDNPVQYKHYPGDLTSLVSNHITDVLISQQGIIWVASYEGISMLSLNSRAFAYHPHNRTFNMDVQDKNIMAIYQDSTKNLWIGTFHTGVYRYAPDGQLLKHYLHDPSSVDGISKGAIASIIEDRDGDIWIATLGGGLNRLNPQTHQFSHITQNETDNQGLLSNSVHVLKQDKTGLIWIGTFKGLNSLDPRTLKITAYVHDPDNNHSLSAHNVMELFVDSNNQLWVGTQKNGLNKFNPDKQNFTRFTHQAEVPGSLSHNFVTSITEDERRQLWIATAGGGLNKWLPEKQQFQHYRKGDGLNSDSIMAVFADNDGLLWMSSDEGLNRLDPVTHQITLFSPHDGLQEKDFYLRSGFKGADGRLFFGGINGFNSFWPDQVVSDKPKPSVAFTDFLLSNRRVEVANPNDNTSLEPKAFKLKQLIHHTRTLTLSHNQRLFTFEFAALGVQNPSEVEYAYQLSGWDETWLQSNYKRRLATYSNIPAGRYQLNVKARLPGADWTDNDSIDLTLLPPWWKTVWAIGLYIVFTASLLILFYWLMLKKRAAEFEKKIAQRERQQVLNIARTKDQLLANISHEFRTPLTLIISPLESLLKQPEFAQQQEKLSLIKRNAQRILTMVDQLLDLAKLKNNDSRPRKMVNVIDSTRLIVGAFQELTKQRAISLNLNDLPPQDWYVSMVEDAYEKVVTNLISNGIKYSANGTQIDVELAAVENHRLRLRVKDQGLGIAPSDQERIFDRFVQISHDQQQTLPSGVGIGLALVKELIVSHNGSIKVESQLNQGSLFEVMLPLAENKTQRQTLRQNSPEKSVERVVSGELGNLSPQKESEVPAIERENEHQPQILIVEDNIEMRDFLVECFSDTYHCLTASNGMKGVSMATEQSPDIIVSDVMMPGMDGYQLVEQLRTNEITSHIPIILLTAKGDMESKLQGWHVEADDYITKPFHIEELTSRVANLLALRARLRQTFGAALSQQSPVELAESPQMSAVDQAFLQKFETCISKNYHLVDLNRTIVANTLFVTERQLNRKLSALVEHNFSSYLTKYRLRKSKTLLLEGHSVSDVADAVGFSSANYFTRRFKSEFNSLPSDIIHQTPVEPAD